MMQSFSIFLEAEKNTEIVATRLAFCLIAPLVLTFRGEIGAGKTSFIRFMLRALGIKSAIKSPSFSLVESYDCVKFQVHHFDFYRIHEEVELEYIGFRDYFQANAICCMEWPERVSGQLLTPDLNCILEKEVNGRLLTVQALSKNGEKIMSCFAY